MCENERTTDSYGAVVLRTAESGINEVLLIRNRHGWSFPKGHIEKNETPEQTAVREVKEETGITISVDTGFCRKVASAREDEDRSIFFFLGKCIHDGAEPIPTAEVKESKWAEYDEAFSLIRFQPDREVLYSAIDYAAGSQMFSTALE